MVFDGPGNFRSWVVWVWFGLSFFAVLRLDFQALGISHLVLLPRNVNNMKLTVESQHEVSCSEGNRIQLGGSAERAEEMDSVCVVSVDNYMTRRGIGAM